MRKILGSLGSILLLIAASIAGTAAEELRQPVVPSTTDVVANPSAAKGCAPLPTEGTVMAARLIVRNSDRPDVGPYTVTLPGYATNDDPTTDRYAPFVIEARPGETLRFDLSNRLDPAIAQNINLHTHGLVVSPRADQPCSPPGDYVFLEVAPGQTEQYRIDIPTTVNGVVGSGQSTYPSGLYWFHSHVHQFAQNQVNAGQTGIISIAPVISPGAVTDPMVDLRLQLNSRYLVLRDIQLSVPHGMTPDAPTVAGMRALWLPNTGGSGANYDTQACRAASFSNPQMLGGPRFGYCGHAGVSDSDGNIIDTTRDTVWMFTVNGQYLPDITIAPGKAEIWRVANLSATATYVLSLADGSGADQDIQLLMLDGVVAAMSNPTNVNQKQVGLALQRVLLMPGARAEILVVNTATHGQDIAFTLRSEGLETGGSNQTVASRTDYNGDPWPPVTIARVIMKGSNAQAQLPSPGQMSVTASQPAVGPASVGSVPPHCITLPGPNFRRRITFADNGTDFLIGSEVVNASGMSVDAEGSTAHTIAPTIFRHANPPESIAHLCAPLGSFEVWEIINTTTELHNFHIHQTKFRLARPGDSGAPPNLAATTAVVDPARIVVSQIPEFANSQSSSEVDVWHDTMPVPPRDAGGNPGRVFVAIPFTDPVQVGTFVFHCHVLEHEDGGMMAAFQVYDPKKTSSTTPVRRSAFINGIPFCGSTVPPDTPLDDAFAPITAWVSMSERVLQSARILRKWLTQPKLFDLAK